MYILAQITATNYWIEVLTKCGVPAIIVGLIILAHFLLRKTYPKECKYATLFGLFLVCLLAAKATYTALDPLGDIKIKIPENTYACDESGNPKTVEIIVIDSTDKEIKKSKIESLPIESFKNRPLNFSDQDSNFAINYGNKQIGLLGKDLLKAINWSPTTGASQINLSSSCSIKLYPASRYREFSPTSLQLKGKLKAILPGSQAKFDLELQNQYKREDVILTNKQGDYVSFSGGPTLFVFIKSMTTDWIELVALGE